jgi:UDP-N-acetylmuramate dehydrogenase
VPATSEVSTFADLTSLRVGGPIGRLERVTDAEALVGALQRVDDRDPSHLLVLGGGTNVIVSDDGFPGTVVVVSGGHIASDAHSDHVDFTADAGVDWDHFVQATLDAGCSGAEMMSGIPGTVGAAPMQNIAAYGQQVADIITAVEVIDRASLARRWIAAEACDFRFRSSRFKDAWPDIPVTARVRFRLPTAQSSEVLPSTYIDVVKYFERTGESPVDLHARRRAVLTSRGTKSMLLDDSDPLARSVGSFFVNPTVPVALAEQLADRYRTRDLRVNYLESRSEQREGMRRVPAAHVMRAAGFRPGDSWGPVRLSDKHLLALVACDGATATDVWRIGHYLRERVHTATDVLLNFEATFIGTFPDAAVDAVTDDYVFVPGPDHEPQWLDAYRDGST